MSRCGSIVLIMVERKLQKEVGAHLLFKVDRGHVIEVQHEVIRGIHIETLAREAGKIGDVAARADAAIASSANARAIGRYSSGTGATVGRENLDRKSVV